jgi:hypothetical protein
MPTHTKFALVLLLTLPAPAAEAQDLLVPAPGPPLEVGRGSGELFLADLDGDGRVDLVSKHLLERRIAIHRGGANGTFRANAHSLALPVDVGAIALGDVDRDGLLDVAIAIRDSTAEYVQIARGTRTGFGEPMPRIRTHAAAATWKPLIRVADLDRDGALDIVVGNGRRASVEILLGDGTGGFALQPGVSLAGAGARHEFELGDIDGDGDLDLVDAGSSESARGFLGAYLGNGRGGFAMRADDSAALPAGPRATTLADIDRDGDLDVLLAHLGPLVSVLLNDGTGRFAAMSGSPFTLPGPAFNVAAVEMNGAGRPDMVAATVGSVTVLLGSSRGYVPAPGSPYPAGPGAYRVVAGDIDADGLNDVVASSFEGSTVRILLGNPEAHGR